MRTAVQDHIEPVGEEASATVVDVQKTGCERRLGDAELIEIATTAVDKIEAQR